MAKLAVKIPLIAKTTIKTALAAAEKDNTEAQARADPKKPVTKNT